jgi:hypothetical protein
LYLRQWTNGFYSLALDEDSLVFQNAPGTNVNQTSRFD